MFNFNLGNLFGGAFDFINAGKVASEQANAQTQIAALQAEVAQQQIEQQAAVQQKIADSIQWIGLGAIVVLLASVAFKYFWN